MDPYREPVELVPVEAAWAERYAGEAARLRAALGRAGVSATIDHIGSTSVPLDAKPIVDVQVVVAESDRAAAIPAIEGLGYRHHGRGGVPGRDYLTLRPESGQRFNVHVFDDESPLPGENRAIRDYLRADPAAAAEYRATKERAIADGFTDLLSYSRAKEERLAAIRAAAIAWAAREQGR